MFRNVVKCMFEVVGCGMWDVDEEIFENLREFFLDVEDEMEGV